MVHYGVNFIFLSDGRAWGNLPPLLFLLLSMGLDRET